MNTTPTVTTRVRHYVVNLFDEQLPAYFTFHTIGHTIAVVDMANVLGERCLLSPADLEVVTIAAWFHDTGYTEVYDGHEEASIRLAEKFLEQSGYPAEHIIKVVGCIRATTMPQSPQTLLEQVLCDADLSNLGGNDFLRLSFALKQEKERHFQMSIPEKDWYLSTLAFCQRHTFHTDVARTLFNEQLQANITVLQDRLLHLPDIPQQ